MQHGVSRCFFLDTFPVESINVRCYNLFLFTLQNNSLYLPKAIEVEITSGSLEIPKWNLSIPLPINGKGVFCVMYVDNNIRIFRSIGGTLSLQVKDSMLP